jgi:hypothetical protein
MRRGRPKSALGLFFFCEGSALGFSTGENEALA